MTALAIETLQLRKVFGEDKVAVEGLTLQVRQGEVFGFLGPNGAGKTTSVKMMLDLVHPTDGSAYVLGQPTSHPETRRKVGFLPEHFRFHEWMRATEFLDVHAELAGLSKADRQQRIPGLLERVGLSEASQQRLSTFSKGMQQRIGLAMAMIHRPTLVFLDEPTSGLDPFGRMLVRDVITKLRDEGTTVFLNSHLLGEIEATCDRVAFIRKGTVIKAGTLDELAGGQTRVRIRVESHQPQFVKDLDRWGQNVQANGNGEISLIVENEDVLPDLATWIVAQGARLYALTPEHVSLESMFVSIMGDAAHEGDGA